MATQQMKFDADASLASVRALRAVQKPRRTWSRSRLTKYRAELTAMRQQGASYGDLVVWLRSEKRTKVDRSTVMRYLQKCMPAEQIDG